jgi:multidrug efflux pump subunit AcrB
VRDAFGAMLRGYERSLDWVLAHQPLTLATTIALAVLTGWLYVTIPKGLFPQQDTGFIFGQAEAREDISFVYMADRLNQLAAIALADPAVSVSGFAGTSAFNPSENVAPIYIQLKPFSQRDVSVGQVIERLRPKMAMVPGVKLYLQAAQDLTFGGRLTRTQYQYTLTSSHQAVLNQWAPILEQRLRGIRQI